MRAGAGQGPHPRGRGFDIADEKQERAGEPFPEMPAQQLLGRLQPRLFIAVQQHGNEEGPGIAALEVEERGPRQNLDNAFGRAVEKCRRHAIEDRARRFHIR